MFDFVEIETNIRITRMNIDKVGQVESIYNLIIEE